MARKRDRPEPTREEKIAALRYNRAQLSGPARRKFDKDTKELQKEGFVDADGLLTGAGELRLHQLNLLKWMKERAEKRLAENRDKTHKQTKEIDCVEHD